MLKETPEVAVPGAESAVYDCLVLIFVDCIQSVVGRRKSVVHAAVCMPCYLAAIASSAAGLLPEHGRPIPSPVS